MNPRQPGFSLIELLVVIALLTVIIGIAVPGYRQYVLRTNRSDATTTLLRIAAAQERYYLENDRYTVTLGELGITGTDRGYYQLSVSADDLARDFRALAVPDGPPQNDDEACQQFGIDETGKRTSTPQPINVCWR